jgi:hypothetical protein
MNEEIERYNVVGNELRKLGDNLNAKFKALIEDMYRDQKEILENQQLILQKLEVLDYIVEAASNGREARIQYAEWRTRIESKLDKLKSGWRDKRKEKKRGKKR